MDNGLKNKTSKNEDTVFFLRVQFRRNTSWQGTLQCLTSRETRIFRSVLELGSLMNEAVTKTEGVDGDKKPDLLVWEDKEDVS